jgi:hypothetical protein
MSDIQLLGVLVLALSAVAGCGWLYDRRQRRKVQEARDLAAVEAILESWARIERRKHGRDGRYRRVYGVITFPHE